MNSHKKNSIFFLYFLFSKQKYEEKKYLFKLENSIPYYIFSWNSKQYILLKVKQNKQIDLII